MATAPDDASPPGDDAVLVRAAHVLQAPFADGTVLLDRRQGRSHVLNASAAAVWHALDGATSVGGLAHELAATAGGSARPGTVATQVRRTLGDLVALGLAQEAGAPEQRPVPAAWSPPPATGRPRTRLAEVASGAATLGPYRVAGTTVVVHADDRSVRDHVAELTASLPAAGGAEHLLEVLAGPGPDGRYSVALDGRHEGTVDGPAAAAGLVVTTTNRLAAAATTGHLLFHAGAVERDGRALVIAGRTGAGKSTLTAALVRAGHGYLTDELVAVDAGGVVLPYPKAIDLSAGSCGLLGVAPPDAGKAGIAPTRFGAVGRPVPVGLVVLLTGAAGRGPGALSERLDPADALVELLPNTFGETFDTDDALVRLVELVERVPVRRCDRFDLARSVALLTEVDLR